MRYRCSKQASTKRFSVQHTFFSPFVCVWFLYMYHIYILYGLRFISFHVLVIHFSIFDGWTGPPQLIVLLHSVFIPWSSPVCSIKNALVPVQRRATEPLICSCKKRLQRKRRSKCKREKPLWFLCFKILQSDVRWTSILNTIATYTSLSNGDNNETRIVHSVYGAFSGLSVCV